MSNSNSRSKGKGPCSGDNENADMSSTALSGITLNTKSPCIAYLVMQEKLREEAEARAAQKARNVNGQRTNNSRKYPNTTTTANTRQNVKQNSSSPNSQAKNVNKASLVEHVKSAVSSTTNALKQKLEARKEAKAEKNAAMTKLTEETYDYILEKFNVPYTTVCKPLNGGSEQDNMKEKVETNKENANAKQNAKMPQGNAKTPQGNANAKENTKPPQGNANAKENTKPPQGNAKPPQGNANAKENTKPPQGNAKPPQGNANVKQNAPKGDAVSDAARNAFLYILVNGSVPTTLVDLVSKEDFVASERVQNIIADNTFKLLASSITKKKEKKENSNDTPMEGGKGASTVEEAFQLCVKFFMKQVKKLDPSPSCTISLTNSDAGTIAAISYGKHYE